MHRSTVSSIAFALLTAGASVAVHAQDFPPRKAGLWEIAMQMPGRTAPVQNLKMCIDPETDAQMYKLGTNISQGACAKHDVKRAGDTVTTDSECKFGKSKSFTHSVTTFTGDTAYHTDISTKFEPPLSGHDLSGMTQDAKWTGACPADMVPGDILMGNGMKMNVKQMLEQK